MAELTWSNSSLTMLQQCGERFRRRYIERELMPPAPRMIRGTAVHRVAAQSYLRKMDTRTLPSVEEARDLGATEFDRVWQQGVALSDDEAKQGERAVRDASKDFAVDLSGYHVAAVAPAVDPVGIERKITVKPKDSDLVIHGTLDLIDRTPSGGESIRDLKTAEKSPPSDAADKSQQFTLYGLIRMAEIGALPEVFTLDTLVRTPVRAEKKHVVLHTTRDADDVGALVNRINLAVEAVKRGIFVPADPSDWRCSKAYCEYFATCPYTRRSDRPKS